MTLPRNRKRLLPIKRTKISQELPEELIRAEILTRLPIKSLVRFKCVCRSWLSLFSNPQFVKQHCTYLNPNDYDCLVAKKSYNFVTFSRYQETFAFHCDQFYFLIGSAKGLVCIRLHNILSLWNPAIRQSKEFKLPPLGYGCLRGAGLGFDHVSNDYKVGILYESVDLPQLCYAVYSCNSDSWIHYQFHDHDYEIFVSELNYSISPTTMVNDCPYWAPYSLVSLGKYKVKLTLTALKFEATSNNFKLLPEFCSDFSSQEKFKVVNMKDLLTLMAYEYCTTGRLHIYSLDEGKGCGGVWSKMYRLGPFKQLYWHFRELQQGFKYGDEIVYFSNSNIYRFDHKTDTVECISGTEAMACSNCFSYTPSLVFLEGMTSIYSEKQSPPFGQCSTTPSRLISSLEGK